MYCPNCGADCGDAKFCPNCGAALVEKPKQPYQPKKPAKKKHRGIKALIIVAVILAVFIGVSVKVSDMPVSPTNSSEEVDLEILDYKQDGLYIVGHIKNNSNKDLTYVEIGIPFTNHGKLVYTGRDATDKLGAGETWAFEVPCMAEADAYTVSEEYVYGT